MKKTKQDIIDQLCHDIDVQGLRIKELEYEKKGLNGQIETILDDARRIRKEFAKSFGWMQQKQYHLDSEPKLPSWEEIFVEVGRLLSHKNMNNLSNEVGILNKIIGEIEEIIDHDVDQCMM